MPWALFEGEKRISKKYEHKPAAYTEANEKGFVLISRNTYWFREGITLREVPEDRTPKVGDKTYYPSMGHGYIAYFTAPNFPAINKAEIADQETGNFQTFAYVERMVWSDEHQHWII